MKSLLIGLSLTLCLFINASAQVPADTDLSRWVVTTAVGDANVGKWAKIATINFGSVQYQDFSLTLQFAVSNARGQNVIVSFTGRQNQTGNAPIYMGVDVLAKSVANVSIFDEGSFKITSNGFGTDFAIYVKRNQSLGQIRVYELSANVMAAGTLTYEVDPAWGAEVHGSTEIYSGPGTRHNTTIRYNLISPYTGNPYSIIATTTKLDGTSITDVDVDSVVFFKINSMYFKRSGGRVDLKDCGGGRGASFDDSRLLQKLLKEYNHVYAPAGTYYVRNDTIPRRVKLEGAGEYTVFRFKPSGNTSTDATQYTFVWTGSYSELASFSIDNAKVPSNGLLIVPNTDGLHRTANNIFVRNCAAYVANPDTANGGGINKNIARADLGTIVGGNGIQIANISGLAAWEIVMNNIRINSCDGVGMDTGNATDSKFDQFIIGDCLRAGYIATGSNVQHSNFKVYRCRMYKVGTSFAESIRTIIPYSETTDGDQGAAVISGPNHQLSNFELQENASYGIQFGTSLQSFSNSTVSNLLVDGNGGYDSSASAATLANYRRPGIFLFNYYNIKISGSANDFRTKVNRGRQNQAFYTIVNKPTINASGQLRTNSWYKIKTLGSGTDFSPVFGNKAGLTNAVGTVFELRNNYQQAYPSMFGSGGVLEAVNDRLFLDMTMENQFDQDTGTGPGYTISGDGGNSIIVINGKRIPRTFSYTAGSINDATQVSTTLTTPCSIGQSVRVSFTQPLQGCRMWAEVTAANTVTVYTRNDTGGAKTISAGTINLLID